jgi:hypothetical protein
MESTASNVMHVFYLFVANLIEGNADLGYFSAAKQTTKKRTARVFPVIRIAAKWHMLHQLPSNHLAATKPKFATISLKIASGGDCHHGCAALP